MCTPRGSGGEGRWSLPGMVKSVYNLQNKQLIKLYTVRYVYFQGSRGEGRWTDKGVYNLQNKQLIKLCSQVCVLPGGVGVRGDGHYLGWSRVFTIYRINSLSNCTQSGMCTSRGVGVRGDGQTREFTIYRINSLSNCVVRYVYSQGEWV